MKVVTIACPKGGTGKTTLVTALAARACLESNRVALIDLNADQGSLTAWWFLRGEPMNPRLFPDPENLTDDMNLLRRDGWDYVLIDTPPLDLDLMHGAVAVADAVLIPVRSSIFDIGAIDPIVEMCTQRRKPFAFVLSAVDGKFKNLTAEVISDLVNFGPVLGSRLSYRLDYINALTVGKTGPELNKKELKPEIDALWTEVKRLAGEHSQERKAKAHV